MGHLVQMAGLAVQNFVSASVGIAVAVCPGLGDSPPAAANRHLGNFWVDLTRILLRILLPICVLATIVFIDRGHGAEPVRAART